MNKNLVSGNNRLETKVLNSGELGMQMVREMQSITMDRIAQHGLENIRRNHQYLSRGKSLAALTKESLGQTDEAIIIAAGPSLKRKDVAAQIQASGFRGAIIATDSSIRYCLSHGIVPDLVVSLDPHATRIVRWFGDPSLDKHKVGQDDYFSRQDMDTAFADELKVNEEILGLLDQHGKKIKIALATCASEAVVNRVLATGMQIYWWNPMYDDPDDQNGMTHQIQSMNNLPCVNAGGNVGTACWMMAHAVLDKKHVALTGVDFSYYDGTPFKSTQYYYEAVDLVGEENLDSIFMRIFNPHTNTWFYTDPAYRWYREIFLDMAKDADCKTYNCTEGGILFGDNIDFVPLNQFLKRKS